MARLHTITGIDIGSNNIKILIVQKKPEEDVLEVLDQNQLVSSGVRRGVVVSVDQVANLIASCVSKSEQKLGTRIDGVYVNINGSHLFTVNSKGLVSVSRADQKISQEDINRVVQNAQAMPLGLNKEVLDVIPKEYIIDGEKGIRDPLGMQGMRLEADILLVGGFTPYLKNLSQAVLSADLKINDQIISPVASGRAVLTPKEKELGVAVLDIGAGTSGLAVFEEGNLIHSTVFPLGSNHVTHDIAIGLTTEIETAEKIKIEYGSCIRQKAGKTKAIKIEKMDGEPLLDPVTFTRKLLTEIIEARALEIFEQTNKELKKISRSGMLPAGIVLTGGGSRAKKIVELAKKELKLPVRIGTPRGFFPMIEDPSWSVACGLVLHGMDGEDPDGPFVPSFLKDFTAKIRRILRVFIP